MFFGSLTVKLGLTLRLFGIVSTTLALCSVGLVLGFSRRVWMHSNAWRAALRFPGLSLVNRMLG